MKRVTITFIAAILLGAIGASPASAAFGLESFDFTVTNQDGSPATQAGSHPFQVTGSVEFNKLAPLTPDGEAKSLSVEQLVGLAGAPNAVPTCSTADFLTIIPGKRNSLCSDGSAVGAVATRLSGITWYGPIFNLDPPPGVAAKLGWTVANTPVVLEVGINDTPPHNIRADVTNIPQTVRVVGSVLTLWGNPGDPAHDPFRGQCVSSVQEEGTEQTNAPTSYPELPSYGECSTSAPNKPFLTLPRACAGPLATTYETRSWQGSSDAGGVLTHDDSIPPKPIGFTGCAKLAFTPQTESQMTADSAETGSGFDFNLDFHDQGLTSPDGIAQSDAKKAVVTLPKGVTINPSIGEGLGVCTPADLGRETVDSAPGEGCPNSSKIGTLQVQTPLVDEPVDGSIFLAQQDDPGTTEPGAENPFDSLIALYFVLKNPVLGAMVKLPVKIEPDPQSGQLVAILDDNPQIPFNHFNAHLRTGARAALVTPAACGTYTTTAVLTPWANPSQPLSTTSSFQITRGVNGGPCPPGGVAPFHPQFEAGSLNNNAGSFSPFNMRLIREDGEQDMTKFSAVLPPGELGSLAGVSKCPDAAIAIAKAKTGKQELASPSCPANSLIGHTLAGAGVGAALTYVKGQIYLGGPFHGDPLSVIAITPAVAGPFDAGTVAVRLALNLNPKTAEVEVDGANSDPIPHILKGIVLKVRDLRVYVDRPDFTLNPTSCEESKARSVLFGSYLDALDPADDRPVDLSTRYQAANCANLSFKPKLVLKLKGGTRRGGHPGLTATYTPKKGDANVKGLVVRLPRSAFLDQAHIKTICTRVQFAAKNCPKGAQYGYIKAWTPLLDEPLQGPVYLRSSNHKLPDLVFDLHGLVDVEVATRIDSAHGGIRATVEDAPDAPLSKVVLQMQGASKGLIVNSRNLCGHVSKANVTFTGHNGKEVSGNPVMQPECGGKRKHKRTR
jgi:hypothetical protein